METKKRSGVVRGRCEANRWQNEFHEHFCSVWVAWLLFQLLRCPRLLRLNRRPQQPRFSPGNNEHSRDITFQECFLGRGPNNNIVWQASNVPLHQCTGYMFRSGPLDRTLGRNMRITPRWARERKRWCYDETQLVDAVLYPGSELHPLELWTGTRMYVSTSMCIFLCTYLIL